MSAAWCGWTMMLLFLCAVFSEVMQPGIISQSHVSIMARTERTYKDAPTNTPAQFLISIFRIGTLAMAICLCEYAGGSFRFASFAAVCGLVLAFILLKMLCNILLDYTFSLSRRFMPVYEQYGDLATITACVLYPCLLVFMRIGRPELSLWALGIIAALFVLVCLYSRALRRRIIPTPDWRSNSMCSVIFISSFISKDSPRASSDSNISTRWTIRRSF